MGDDPARVRWGAVTAGQRAAIAEARRRRWPADVPVLSSRPEAVELARRFASDLGVGHVVHEEGEVIIEDAEYRGRVDEQEIARAEAEMRMRFPSAWRAFLQRSVWFYRGWMTTGAYVWLSTPAESASLVAVFDEGGVDRPGMIPIGNDGGSEMFTVDARDPRSPVTATPNVSDGWDDSIVQCASIEDFVDAVEHGTFEFVFGDD